MKERTIRVGIIRCDTHGYWYAPLFQEPDPDAMRKYHRGCHYYFYRRDDPRRLRFPPVPGMEVARVYDPKDRKAAEGLSAIFGGRPKVCKRLEEASDDVDLIYIADCSLEAKDHLRLATPGLKKGVPHFVDKPFAYTLRDARRMIALAQEHGTALMCASLLRWAPQYEPIRARMKDIAPVSRVEIASLGPSLAGVFHGVSVVQNVMGCGCEWVESLGPTLFDVMRLHYPGPEGGVEVILFNARDTAVKHEVTASNYHHCEVFYASVFGAEGSMRGPRVGDYEYPVSGRRVVQMAREMALTRRPPLDYAMMIEPVEIIEAARKAHRTGRRIAVASLR